LTKVLRGKPNDVTLDIGLSNAAAGRKTLGNRHIAKSPLPGGRASCSLGRYALRKPGDCRRPDTGYVASDDGNVKTLDNSPVARRSSDCGRCQAWCRHLTTLHPAGAVFYNSDPGTSRLPVRPGCRPSSAQHSVCRGDCAWPDRFRRFPTKEPFALGAGRQIATALASNFTLVRHGGGHAVGLGLFLLSATLASRRPLRPHNRSCDRLPAILSSD
jgi:hypothetical protein